MWIKVNLHSNLSTLVRFGLCAVGTIASEYSSRAETTMCLFYGDTDTRCQRGHDADNRDMIGVELEAEVLGGHWKRTRNVRQPNYTRS